MFKEHSTTMAAMITGVIDYTIIKKNYFKLIINHLSHFSNKNVKQMLIPAFKDLPLFLILIDK